MKSGSFWYLTPKGKRKTKRKLKNVKKKTRKHYSIWCEGIKILVSPLCKEQSKNWSAQNIHFRASDWPEVEKNLRGIYSWEIAWASVKKSQSRWLSFLGLLTYPVSGFIGENLIFISKGWSWKWIALLLDGEDSIWGDGGLIRAQVATSNEFNRKQMKIQSILSLSCRPHWAE